MSPSPRTGAADDGLTTAPDGRPDEAAAATVAGPEDAGPPVAEEPNAATEARRRHRRRAERLPSPDEDMGTGRTFRLSAPPAFRLLDIGAIADDVVVTAGEDRHLTTVYLDTTDLRLVRWGAVLRHRAGEGWTVRLPRAPGEKRRREFHFDGEAAAPPAAAVELLRAWVRTARLRPVARLRTVRRTLVLSTHEGRRLAEIDDDEVSVLDGRRVASRFREVDVDLVEDAPARLSEGILSCLVDAGCGVVDPTPKLVHALGARAVEPPEITVPEIDRRSSAGAVVHRAISASVLRLLERDGGLRTALDPEDVHQARVATRRLRSDLRTLAPLVVRTVTDPIRDELSWLAGELGAVRDAEVMEMRLRERARGLLGGDAEAGLRIASALDRAISTARRDLARSLRSERYFELLDRLVELAREPRLTELAEHPAAEICPELVAVPWRGIRRAVARLDDPPADDALHEVRIDAKRVRYAAELVAPALGRHAVSVGRAAAALQEVLGDFHDAIVAAEWLRAHGEAGDGAFVAGQLYAQELAAAQRGRDEWRQAWRTVRREWSSWT